MKKISLIFSCFNEEHNPFFIKALKLYSSNKNLELICIDGGSTDKTLSIIEQYPNIIYASLANSSRAARLNLGLQYATGDIIILHHPRSILSLDAFKQLESLKSDTWGGFTHCFDHSGLLYSFTSWYSNHIRLRYKQIVYLDHCIFLHKQFLTYQPLFEDVKIFEDTLLSNKLKQYAKPILLPAISTTSSIRFKKNGLFKQALLNQIAKILFIVGIHPNSIDKLYEKNLSLNSRYQK
ncbi:MAG TPA: glycosyltransferase [Oligoflexia bacterium]|nr:glycosyltransferase [Oligoflexia bacterium]HMR25312.1 glycosyltransferase [Oligoflexia bacterium]